MQDGIIKGVGNSRYLKSVPAFLSLYPTYEAFCEALIAGTLPIDLNGINEAGWTQTGTPLNKASLLKDSTAAALGLASSAVPDEALAKIKTLIDAATNTANSKAKIQLGSYVGTGTYGEDNPCSLTFDFAPTFLYIARNENFAIMSPLFNPASSSGQAGAGISYNLRPLYSIGGSTPTNFMWISRDNSGLQMNDVDRTYQYLALG